MKLSTKFRLDRHSFRPPNVASKKSIRNRFWDSRFCRFCSYLSRKNTHIFLNITSIQTPSDAVYSSLWDLSENTNFVMWFLQIWQENAHQNHNLKLHFSFHLLRFCFALPQPRMLWSSSVMNHILPSQCFSFPVMMIPSFRHVSPSSPVSSSSSLQLIFYSLAISRPLC